jgi:hypothetical protein
MGPIPTKWKNLRRSFCRKGSLMTPVTPPMYGQMYTDKCTQSMYRLMHLFEL